MNRRRCLVEMARGLGLSMSLTMTARPARAQAVDRDADAALQKLYGSAPAAKRLAGEAKGILVFPRIVKAGFLVGAQYGEGVLLKDGKPAGHYNIAAGSYGFQAGAQQFAYAMFFMKDSALTHLENSAGFEIGAGPSVVVLDRGKAKTMTTTTARDDGYAFVFGQKALMTGLRLQR